MTDVLDLPFDQYQRYRLTADLIDEARAKGERLRVLDVGGRTALLRSFLPKDDVHLVDVESSSERGLVLGSGAALPFKDASFDAVCAFDTLEHVPPPLRRDFVRECARVAKRWVLLAGPYEAPRVVEAEQILQRFLRDKLKVEHRYLNEHRHNGLPVREEVERELRAAGGSVASFGHADLERWLIGMCLSMYLDEDPALRGLAKSFHRYYNRELFRSDHGAEVYRHVVVAALRGAPLPKAVGALDAPTTPRGLLAPFARLVEELGAFDKERAAWRDERDKLRRVAKDLDTDLAGHRSSLAKLQTRLDEQTSVIADLEVDLEGHRRSVADLERDRAELAAQRARDAADFAAVRRTLEADLAGHKQTLEDLGRHTAALELRSAELETSVRAHAQVTEDMRRDLDAHRELKARLEADLARVERTAAELTANLAQTNEIAAKINAELVATLARLDALARELIATRADVDEARAKNAVLDAANVGLREELNSRWNNFKRAFALRKPRY
ncbi:MAG: methyltransferase domain-containing protein [Planctomycetes bacterium]|nr:methyltransferase domain-containing protein [Planctomycetota bacterium]